MGSGGKGGGSEPQTEKGKGLKVPFESASMDAVKKVPEATAEDATKGLGMPMAEYLTPEVLIAELKVRGVLPAVTPGSSPFLESFQEEINKVDDDKKDQARDLVHAVECILGQSVRYAHFLALTCVCIKDTLKTDNATIARSLADATNQLYSESWISRLINAGDMMMNYPEARNVKDIEKLNVISRLENRDQKKVFQTGRVTDAIDLHEGTRDEIQQAVDEKLKRKPRPKFVSDSGITVLGLASSLLQATHETDGESALGYQYDELSPIIQAAAALLYASVVSVEEDKLKARINDHGPTKKLASNVSSLKFDPKSFKDFGERRIGPARELAAKHLQHLRSLYVASNLQA